MPCEFVSLMVAFAPLFSKPIFQHVQVLLIGAILSPGKRTVTQALRVMGKSQDTHFQNYHRVLNRAVWSALSASRILLGLLVATFAPEGALVMGLDDTIERRRGDHIAAKGNNPRPGALLAFPFRQGERFALALLDAPGGDSLGWPCLGVALPDCAVSL